MTAPPSDHPKGISNQLDPMVSIDEYDWRAFVSYSPYETYFDSTNRAFLDSKRKPTLVHQRNPDNPDTEAIWRVGKTAFELLEITDHDDFARRHQRFKKMVNEWRELIADLVTAGKLVDGQGKAVTRDSLALDQRESTEVLSLAWEIVDQTRELGLNIEYSLRGEQMAFACLQEVDNVIVGMSLDGRSAVASAIFAANALADAQAYLNGSSAYKKARTKMAFDAAVARHRNDPKQADKKFVQQCYLAWRKHPERYKSKAAFARDMLEKCEHLESQKKIEDWVRDWDKRAGLGTLPAE